VTVQLLDFESPYGCRWCGTQKDHHGRRYKMPVDMHSWEAPDTWLILLRMHRRRAARLNAEPPKYHATTGWAPDSTGEEGIPYCADCGSYACRQWIRIQDRLDRRRWQLAEQEYGTPGVWGGEPPW